MHSNHVHTRKMNNETILKPETLSKKVLNHSVVIGIGTLAAFGVHKLLKTKSIGLIALIPIGIITSYGLFTAADMKTWNKALSGNKK